MKTKLAVMALMAGAALFAETHLSIGVQLGGPAGYRPGVVVPAPGPVPVASAYRPPWPGPGYVWIDGYYDAYGNWFDGYWALPPYAGAYWIAPRLYGGRFYSGYWGRAGGGYSSDYRVAPRAPDHREPVQRGNEFRDRSGGTHPGPGSGRGRDFSRGYRR